MIAPAPLIEYVQQRLDALREELAECREVGVDTPGFNQTLGALDELQFLLAALPDMADK